MASIWKRTDSAGRVRWTARYRDPAGKQRSKAFDKKSEAEDWLAHVNVSSRTGQYVDPHAGRVTLADYYAAFADRQLWAPTTRALADNAVKSTPFYEAPLARITPSAVEAWVRASSKTLAASTVKTRLNYVRVVIRGAVRDRHIATDPTEGVQAPRQATRRASMTIPTAQDVSALLRAAQPRDRAAYALAAFAGLRSGEVFGLNVDDVDFLGRVIHVRRQARHGELVPPKTKASERDVPVPDELLQIIAEHVRRWPTTSGLLLREQVLLGGTVRTAWRRTCARANVEGVRLHDLRHFYVSGLIAAGCDVVTVQRALGHESASTTLETYSHLWPDASDRTRAAASGIAAQVLDDAPRAHRVHTNP